ncbi:IS21 family transposase [bacterium]|nr:IS21 family transposase [bacterium]MBU3955868.1 IS21 family transposase [bacterium]
MVKRSMYHRIQNLKKKGFSKAEIMRATGLNKRTVMRYYRMDGEDYLRYIEKVQYRSKMFERFKPHILEVYQKNDFQKLEKSAVYDYLEEKLEILPGSERSLRNYISYLLNTGQLEFGSKTRIYYPVEDLPYGKQMQIDFGEYRTRSGMKLYIFAAVLSASRYKYCALQDKPFTSLDLINHLLDCFEYIGGMPEELVIDQDSVMVVSENSGDIIYTSDFKQFKEEMSLKVYVCRKSDPESKGKIENLIKFVKRNFLKIRDFESIEEAKERLFKWLSRRANGKISLATKRIPMEMFTEEKKHLRGLRNSIYRNTTSSRERRKADNLGQISVNSRRYPVPEEYQSKEVEIYKSDGKLLIYDILTGEQLREYDISPIPGSRIKNRQRNHRKELKQKELKDRLQKLFEIDSWSKFVEKNFQTYPRYFRDQYNEAMKKFCNGIDVDYLRQAINLCLENRTYTMANLWDTYKYFKQDGELPDVGFKINMEPKLRGITSEKKEFEVEKRDINVYHTLVNIPEVRS